MQFLSNLSARAKLILSFVLVSLITVVVGGVGVVKMGAINDMLTTMYERDLMGWTKALEANTSLASIRQFARDSILSDDPKEMAEIRQKVDTKESEFNTQLEACAATIVTEEGKACVAEVRRHFADYMRNARVSLSLSEQMKNKEAQAALKAGAASAAAVREAVDRLIDTKEKLAKQANEDSDTVYEQARLLVIGCVIVGAILGLILGWVIARWFAKALLEVSGIATALASASQQLSAASEEISSGAQEQASNLEETASSLEEITSTVKQNADNAQQANQLAVGAREVAEKGGQVVASAIDGMTEINRSSKKIAEIITAIDEIAFQTNLLALNAAVEAARAGEQGRGFAVVAGEVRNLAQRSAAAAKEIKELIQDSVRKVETGSELVNKSGQTLQEIVTSVKRVTDIVSEIAAASREQSSGIDQVSRAVAQMDQVTQANASQTEELSGTAQSLSGQAQELQDVVGRFKLSQDVKPGSSHRSHVSSTFSKPKPAAKPMTNGKATNGKHTNGKASTNGKAGAHELDLVGAGAGANRLNGHFEEF
jgi:methyl-accepting chemotaxis protein